MSTPSNALPPPASQSSSSTSAPYSIGMDVEFNGRIDFDYQAAPNTGIRLNDERMVIQLNFRSSEIQTAIENEFHSSNLNSKVRALSFQPGSAVGIGSVFVELFTAESATAWANFFGIVGTGILPIVADIIRRGLQQFLTENEYPPADIHVTITNSNVSIMAPITQLSGTVEQMLPEPEPYPFTRFEPYLKMVIVILLVIAILLMLLILAYIASELLTTLTATN